MFEKLSIMNMKFEVELQYTIGGSNGEMLLQEQLIEKCYVISEQETVHLKIYF